MYTSGTYTRPDSPARQRVLSITELARAVHEHQMAGRRVALCHGCFDILHFGHLRHLEAARELADVLVVTVTPDRYVNKGPHRPVFTVEQRAELVAGLAVVDCVAVNEWPRAVETIEAVRPDIFVKGQEYDSPDQQVNPNFVAEKTAIEAIGGVVTFTHEETSSSTWALSRLAAATKAESER